MCDAELQEWVAAFVASEPDPERQSCSTPRATRARSPLLFATCTPGRTDGDGRTIGFVAEWFSIEVLDGDSAARLWADAHGDDLVWRAQEHGATDWSWEQHSWGVVLEVELADEEAWERLLASPRVQAALDAVPNPAFGLITHRGRGGTSGARLPRRPRPITGAGAASLPIPDIFEDVVDDVRLARPTLVAR